MHIKQLEKRTKEQQERQRLITLAVFLVSLLVYMLIMGRLFEHEREMAGERCKLNAQIYAEELEKDFNQSSVVTEMLSYMIADEGGRIRDFPAAAAAMLKRSPYIDTIMLAPGGVIEDIYPEAHRDFANRDLFALPDRAQSLEYSQSRKSVVLQGPFQLRSENEGIAVRRPVYLAAADGQDRFWGFAIVAIRVPDIFTDTVEDLKATGNDYRLLKTEPGEEEYHVVQASKEVLDQPAIHTFFFGGCYWRLEVAPQRGWGPSSPLLISFFLGLGIVFLLTGMTYLLQRFQAQRKYLHHLANTDALTGLYNRQGFDEAVSDWLYGHPDTKATAVILDIDNFKLVNDLYSHRAGDEALRSLARLMRQHFPEPVIVGRNGGDEFCLFLPGLSAEQSEARLQAFVERLHAFRYGDQEHSYTVSLGYAEYPTQARSRSNLFQCADAALYAVKLNGKRGLSHYAPHVGEAGRSQLAFGLQDIAMHLPGAILIYKADRDEEILFANLELIHLFDCTSIEEFFTYTGGTFRGLVHPDDYDAVEKDIWQQVHQEGSSGNDAVIYRIVTKKGRIFRVLDKGCLVDTDFYGRIFYVVLLAEDSWQ